ncbi:2-dehydropantoate 2-reductase [Endozoicomonas sp. SM1973]|uniref:2-dehydropantoate 2-reductase n=1 Tax=Spartinivicinus marinus TaxID=2994442 RepID=A0A853I5M6_9GAMM|nr:2-dehydropantoate 2-reductase [Spartinivicinus marinus]MCX4028358.1 2-dehydropantoate 2-reductase [Spartinivicinus marinus]NYZ68643.1 2-dehydropantoate 2-reductase [Spartinivicinus marinus]
MTQSPNNQPWYILGAGAIGCLLASQLVKQQLPVNLIIKRAHTLSQTIHYQQTDLHFSCNVPIVDHCTRHHTITKLIVTTKAYDALPAVQSIAHLLTADAQIILLQNGLGSQQAIANTLPDQQIAVGSVTHGCFLTKPFQVVHAGLGQIILGELSPQLNNAKPSSQFQQFAQLPLDIHWTTTPLATLWEKVAINSAINGLTALYQCKNGELWQNQGVRQRVIALCLETEAILKKLQIPLSDQLATLVKRVILQTADNYSSTLQDVKAGKATELSYINGYIIDKAQIMGIDLPHHQWLVRTLKEKGYS